MLYVNIMIVALKLKCMMSLINLTKKFLDPIPIKCKIFIVCSASKRLHCFAWHFPLWCRRACVHAVITLIIITATMSAGVRRLPANFIKARVSARGRRGQKVSRARRLNSLFAYDIEQQSCIKCLLCAAISALIISPVNAILFMKSTSASKTPLAWCAAAPT